MFDALWYLLQCLLKGFEGIKNLSKSLHTPNIPQTKDYCTTREQGLIY